MNKFLFLLIAGIAYLVYTGQFKGVRGQVAGQVASAEADAIVSQCKAKKHCITAYVAPWCAVCKASIPSLRLIDSYVNENTTDIGFNIVVGAGQTSENDKEVEKLHPLKAVADNSGELMKSEDIKAFPTWVVRAKSGREIFRRAGGLQLSSPKQAEVFLHELMANQ
jgi:hypothetical protein